MARKNKSNEIPVGSPSGLPLFYIAVVESARMAGMTERDAIRLMVRSWFGDEVANLLDARIRRTGEGSRWREELAKLAGYPGSSDSLYPCSSTVYEAFGGPFWELINFSDCEGAIGPKTSAKLAEDFAGFRKKLDGAVVSMGFVDTYDEFEKAFQLAADGGAVCFH